MIFYHIPTATEYDDHGTFANKLTRCGEPWKLDLTKFDSVPVVREPLTDTTKQGYPVLEATRYYYPAISKTAEELAPIVPFEVTMRQARISLAREGLLDDVEALVAQIGGEAVIVWEYSSMVQRNNPLVAAVMTQAGWTTQQIDNLFIMAATL